MGKGLICSQLQSSAKYECINKIQPCLCVCERERRGGGAGAPGQPGEDDEKEEGAAEWRL